VIFSPYNRTVSEPSVARVCLLAAARVMSLSLVCYGDAVVVDLVL
jgi:hypothetical protein